MQDAGPTALSYTRASGIGTNWVMGKFSPAIARTLQQHLSHSQGGPVGLNRVSPSGPICAYVPSAQFDGSI